MSQEHKSAGIDLDSLTRYDSFETDEGDELRVDPNGRWVRFDDVRELLARRAESSVTEADERALFEADTRELYPAATFGRFPVSDNYNVSWVQEQWGGWQRRAALASPAVPEGHMLVPRERPHEFTVAGERAGVSFSTQAKLWNAWFGSNPASPAVSQKDGAADCTEPNREACPRLCRDFCNAAEEARAATTASASSDEARTVIANLASVVRAQNGNRHADINELLARAEKCLAPALSLDTDTGTTGTAVRNTLFPGPSIGDVLASKDREISDLRAALAQQGASQAPLDVRAGFEKWMSDRGEAANYAGDGMYESPSVNRKAEAFRAGVEYVALARAPLPAKDRELADVLRDMLAIQEACGLHTDEYAPGSVIEYIKEMEGESVTAPAQAGDATYWKLVAAPSPQQGKEGA